MSQEMTVYDGAPATCHGSPVGWDAADADSGSDTAADDIDPTEQAVGNLAPGRSDGAPANWHGSPVGRDADADSGSDDADDTDADDTDEDVDISPWL